MAAFPGDHKNLTGEQREALEIIHRLTVSWARGHVTDKLLEEIEIGDGKNKAALADAIMDLMTGNSGDSREKDSKGKKAGGVIKQLYMELTTEDSQPKAESE